MKKLLDLFKDEFKAIDGHPMVVIASGIVRRGLEAMVGCRFVGHPGMPGNIFQAAKFNSSLYLLKECLVLEASRRQTWKSIYSSPSLETSLNKLKRYLRR